jgi:hypothetical protein
VCCQRCAGMSSERRSARPREPHRAELGGDASGTERAKRRHDDERRRGSVCEPHAEGPSRGRADCARSMCGPIQYRDSGSRSRRADRSKARDVMRTGLAASTAGVVAFVRDSRAQVSARCGAIPLQPTGTGSDEQKATDDLDDSNPRRGSERPAAPASVPPPATESRRPVCQRTSRIAKLRASTAAEPIAAQASSTRSSPPRC